MIADAVEQAPAASFPEQARTGAAIEATYRFLSNGAIKHDAILKPHIARTVARGEASGAVVVIHDTSEFKFGGEAVRTGLGRIKTGDQGFLGHVSLGVGPDGEIFGVVGLDALVRTGPPKGKRSQKARSEDETLESRRWSRQALSTQKLFSSTSSVVHVMDREADAFEILAALQGQARFVVRVNHDRAVQTSLEDATAASLFNSLAAAPVRLRREVPLSRRGKPETPKERKIHPERAGRMATLALRACQCTINPPTWMKKDQHQPLTLNYVLVDEVDAPADQPAVCWRLVTTEPVETAEDIERVVDIYRRRWTIEEFFKCIKTGCSYEKRQLESKEALLNALAILLPMAAQLLHLRWLSRLPEDRPAAEVLTHEQIAALGALERKAGRHWPSQPTARDAIRAVSILGGHIKNNGAPGWLVLWRGLQKLGWIAIGFSLLAYGEHL